MVSSIIRSLLKGLSLRLSGLYLEIYTYSNEFANG